MALAVSRMRSEAVRSSRVCSSGGSMPKARPQSTKAVMATGSVAAKTARTVTLSADTAMPMTSPSCGRGPNTVPESTRPNAPAIP